MGHALAWPVTCEYFLFYNEPSYAGMRNKLRNCINIRC